MTTRHLILKALNTACTWIDEVAYRPAVVKLTLPLPRWWNCQLADLAWHLDRRWKTGYYKLWGPRKAV